MRLLPLRSLLGALLLLAPVAYAADVLEDPLERRTLDIAKELRCAVCQNQSVSESNAPLAQDMRKIIREQLEAGKSHDQIVAYFVERYGDYVLMKPPYTGIGLYVWIGPLLLLAGLGTGAFLYVRSRVGKPMAPPAALSKEDLARVRAARAEEP
jgi:cytochrome c-type biogenesis protein CcmH